MSVERDLLAALGRQGSSLETSEGTLERRRQVVQRLAALDDELGRKTQRRKRFGLLGLALSFAAATALGAPLVVEALDDTTAPPAPSEPSRSRDAARSVAEPASRSDSPPPLVPATAGSRVISSATGEPLRAPASEGRPEAGNRAVITPPRPDLGRPGPGSTLALENELLAQAKSEARKANYSAALSHLDDLIQRFPRSPLYQNARVERFRVLSKMGQAAQAAQAARRYLADFPGGFARDEARALAVP